jgi:hypothetical protein
MNNHDYMGKFIGKSEGSIVGSPRGRLVEAPMPMSMSSSRNMSWKRWNGWHLYGDSCFVDVPCYVFWEVGSPLNVACWLEIIFHVRNIAYVVPRVLPLNISGCGMGLFKSHDTSIFAMKMHWTQISCANLSIVLVLIQLSLGWFKANIVQETHGYHGCLPPKMGFQPQIFQGGKSASMPEAQAFLEILKQKRPELLRWTGEWLGMSPAGL